MNVFRTDNPFTGEIAFERGMITEVDIDPIMHRAVAAHQQWRQVPLSERIAAVERFCQTMEARAETYAAEITQSMGKPLKQAIGEVSAACDRARQLAGIAEHALRNIPLPDKEGFDRWIQREPVGVVVVLAAWNYPLLVPVNALIAGVLAGNAVVIKHSDRSPRCGEQLAEAFELADVPEALVQNVHAYHDVTGRLAAHPSTGFVSFTGSVRGGRAVYSRVASERFIDVGLELGGKDPAYVASDVDVAAVAETLVDGATYNAGQSCCAIERVYVHHSVYDRFLDAAVAAAKELQIGDPMQGGTTLGPMAQPNAPAFLAAQVADARAKGARVLCGGRPTSFEGKGRFFEPTIVADTNHTMSIAREESFGPVLSVQSVVDDAEAVRLMNDSDFGLTASVWTQDVNRARPILAALEAGTVFLNRCDFLDPLLAWTGVKDSGKGASLSELGFQAVTRPKSFHLRLP